MTKDDIIRMARQAGYGDALSMLHSNALERFADLVAAAEREACAEICDAVQRKNEEGGAWLWEAKNCAISIRTRGQK